MIYNFKKQHNPEMLVAELRAAGFNDMIYRGDSDGNIEIDTKKGDPKTVVNSHKYKDKKSIIDAEIDTATTITELKEVLKKYMV